MEPKRLVHFSPLRYPGGKSKLTPFLKSVLQANDLEDGWYAEPFAGGAGAALELLLQGYVSRVLLNDISLPIYAFWKSVTEDGDRFAELIESAVLTVEEWRRQRAVISSDRSADLFELGFAAFYLNRTNRSGVLNGGPIGGLNQSGRWLIDARFNRTELAYRVRRVSALSTQIEVTCEDAVQFLIDTQKRLPRRSLIYADPPYFEKGRQLYYDYYRADDHARLAKLFRRDLSKRKWLVSYDDVPEIRGLYGPIRSESYCVPYSVRSKVLGSEVMFYSPGLVVPTEGPADRFSLAS